MKRRTAIRNVVLLSAGAAFLHACQDKATIALDNIPLTGSQEDLLAQLSEAIIPTTEFIGAKELKSQEFVLVMIDDCATPEEQEKFMKGLQAFDDACSKKFNKGFVKLSPEQRAEFLQLVETDKEFTEVPEGAVSFYRSVKRYTIQSFVTSQKFLADVKNVTSLIPGKFKGCVPVNAA